MINEPLKLFLIVNSACITLALVCTLVLAIANSGSRNLALASGTFLAASVLYFVQLFFELRSEEQVTRIMPLRVRLDRQENRIGYLQYLGESHPGAGSETWAGRWLFEKGKTSDIKKAANDILLFDVFALLTGGLPFWEGEMLTHVDPDTGHRSFQGSGVIKPGDAYYDFRLIKAKFTKAQNLLADYEKLMWLPQWYLPPRTRFDVNANSLELKNPFCSIRFTIEDLGRSSSNAPGTMEAPEISPGVPRYIWHDFGVTITTRISRYRAHHRQKEKYQKWLSLMTSHVEEVLTPPPPKNVVR